MRFFTAIFLTIGGVALANHFEVDLDLGFIEMLCLAIGILLALNQDLKQVRKGEDVHKIRVTK